MHDKISSLRDYVLITLMILASKTVYFGIINARQTYLILGAVLVLFLFIRKKQRRMYNRSNALIIFLVLILTVFQIAVNPNEINSSFINTMIVSYLPFLFCFIFVDRVTKESYITKYVNVMTFIAIISLVCFSVAVFSPMVAWGICQRVQFNDHIYNISPYYTWGWNTHIFARNSGPFWEPGAYQGFLIIAILFLLFNKESIKHIKIKFLLFVVTVLTTSSTTGYILATLLVITFHKRIEDIFLGKGRSLRTPSKIIVFLLLVGVVGYIIYSGNISDKFTSTNVSGNVRRNDLANSLIMIFDKPIFGYSFTAARTNRSYELGIASNSVGLTALLYTCGIPFGSMYIFYMISGMKKFFMNASQGEFVILVITLLILHCTEAVWWLPIYVLFLFTFKDTPDLNLSKKQD